MPHPRWLGSFILANKTKNTAYFQDLILAQLGASLSPEDSQEQYVQYIVICVETLETQKVMFIYRELLAF